MLCYLHCRKFSLSGAWTIKFEIYRFGISRDSLIQGVYETYTPYAVLRETRSRPNLELDRHLCLYETYTPYPLLLLKSCCEHDRLIIDISLSFPLRDIYCCRFGQFKWGTKHTPTSQNVRQGVESNSAPFHT